MAVGNTPHAGNLNDIRVLSRVLWSRAAWIVLVTAVFSALSVTVALLTVPVYRATVVVMPDAASPQGTGALGSALSQLGGLATMAGINVGGNNSEVAAVLAVLQSREFVQRFIADRDLLPVLFGKKWDPKTRSWIGPKKTWPTLGDGYRQFAGPVLDVVQDKKSSLVTVAIEWTNPEEAADWANDLIRRANAEMRDRARTKADASLKYLEAELGRTNDVGTRDAINHLIESQVQQRMLANVTEEFAFRVVDKAVVPELRDKVRPKRVLWVLVGTALGFLLACTGAIFVHRLNEPAS